MSNTKQFVEELRRAYAGDPWHGSSLVRLLAGIDADAAAKRPLPGVHSIWEIVLHTTGWTREVALRLQGNPVKEPAAGDWPAVGDPSTARWQSACADLAAANQELERALTAFSEKRLDEPVGTTRDAPLGAGYSFATMINGVLQHHAYHGGQIAVLKNALTVK